MNSSAFYGVICVKSGKIRRYDCLGVIAAAAITWWHREEGWTVTVLPLVRKPGDAS